MAPRFSQGHFCGQRGGQLCNVIHAACALSSKFGFMVQGSDDGQVKLNLWIHLQRSKLKPKTIFNSFDVWKLKMQLKKA